MSATIRTSDKGHRSLQALSNYLGIPMGTIVEELAITLLKNRESLDVVSARLGKVNLNDIVVAGVAEQSKKAWSKLYRQNSIINYLSCPLIRDIYERLDENGDLNADNELRLQYAYSRDESLIDQAYPHLVDPGHREIIRQQFIHLADEIDCCCC